MASRIINEAKKEIEGIVGKNLYSEFKNFAFKNNILQLAISFILGAACQKVINSISENLFMPFLSYAIEFTGKDWRLHTYSPIDGLTLETGKFAAASMDFLLISVVLFLLLRYMTHLLKEEEKPKEIICYELIECKYCNSDIDYEAIRCPNCTSWLKENVDELLVEEDTT